MKSAMLSLFLTVASWTAAAQDQVRPVLEMDLEDAEAIPGQPVLLRVTLLVPTWLPKAPVFPSFETPNVIVRLPERASGPTSKEVGGETWSGVTRAYRLYPMTVGRFRLPSQPLIITYADPETSEPVTVTLQTDEVSFEGIAPEGAEDLDPFIAAEALTLEQAIDGVAGEPGLGEIEMGEIEAGDAVTWQVTAKVKGTSPIFLPDLIPPAQAEGISVYPKEPVVIEPDDNEVPAGERLESVTYMGEAGGRLTAPPISLRWFNLGSGQIETAELPGFEIMVGGEPQSRPSAFDWRDAVPWIIGGLLITAILGAVGMRLRPRINAWRRERADSYLQSEAFAFTQAEKAVRARNLGDSIRLIERWSSHLPSADGRKDRHLAHALTDLGASLYGRSAEAASSQRWSEAARALKAARVEREAVSARVEDVLPPLNPH